MSSMAIDTAYVEVKPESGGFAGELKRDIDAAFRQIERTIKNSLSGVTNEFQKSGEKAEDSFKETSRAAKREFDKVEKEARTSTKQTGGHFKSMFAAIGLGFLAIKTKDIFAGFIADARESIKVGKLTAQVIETTGSAANLTAKQVGKLSEAISNKTGIDDEQIQTSANLLLTFTNIRNEVGKGNDIFTQATARVQDMSVALGQDAKSGAIQLGKALNDPIKGVTALQRVGVSFTASQKEQIKTLVESGDIMGAQKIILAELGKEFGGAAEAAATPWDRFKVTMGNIGERIGTALIPVLDSAAVWLAERLPAAIETVSGFFTGTLKPGIDAAVQGFKDGEDPIAGFAGFMYDVGVFAKDTADFFKDDLLPPLKEFGDFTKDTIVPMLQDMVGFIKDNTDFFGPFAIAIGVATVAMWAYATATTAAAVATGIVTAPVWLVVTAIAALVAGLVWAYQHSEAFRLQVRGMGIVVREVFQGIWMTIQAAGRIIGAVFEGIGFVIRATRDVFSNLGTFWRLTWDGIKEIARNGVQDVVGFFLDMAGRVLGAAESAFGWIPGLGGKLKDANRKFKDFRDDVNRNLAGIDDESVSITATGIVTTRAQQLQHRPRAGGGPITGPGTGTSDSILVPLSNGEHVMTAQEVNAMGGHAEVMRFRKSIRGMRAGGPVQFNVPTRTPSTHFADHMVSGLVADARGRVVKSLQDELAQMLESGPIPQAGDFRRILWRGKAVNARTARMIIAAERSIGQAIRIIQGSYSTRVRASAGTHAGGGVVDVGPATGMVNNAMRQVGFASWIRTPAQGPWGYHIHAVAKGDPTVSPAARRQVQSYLSGGNGLGGFGIGGIVPRSGLGMLHGGEVVINPDFPSRAQSLLARVGMGGTVVLPSTMEVHIHVAGSIRSDRDLVRIFRDEMARLVSRGDPVAMP